MSPQRPSEEYFQKLVKYGIAEIKDNKYIYTQEFTETIKSFVKRQPNKLESFRIVNRIKGYLSDALFVFAGYFGRSKVQTDNLIIAGICLDRYNKANNNIVPKDDMAFVAYAIWYLNDHEPEVEDDI